MTSGEAASGHSDPLGQVPNLAIASQVEASNYVHPGCGTCTGDQASAARLSLEEAVSARPDLARLLMKDRDPDVRRAAVLYAGTAKQALLRGDLERAVERDEDRHVRTYAIAAIEQIGAAPSIRAVTRALRDKSAEVRAMAGQTLVDIGHPVSFKFLDALDRRQAPYLDEVDRYHAELHARTALITLIDRAQRPRKTPR
ncbi:MAG: HEAT repeat domain-containing protein [Fimbriimonadales bacterium]